MYLKHIQSVRRASRRRNARHHEVINCFDRASLRRGDTKKESRINKSMNKWLGLKVILNKSFDDKTPLGSAVALSLNSPNAGFFIGRTSGNVFQEP